ncbi:MAG: deoxyribose-phosphate aldolase [Verrucomicrobia bacterium CG_4_10_14_3_um_filter_43_23]|nr:MAG: deoxyribose-phosphate aldolase [Verrucomicrobia bacterium CG1_02_43_26]PIP60057.1 MAG: deoxyribose-phosphate aldolase [Verrucomicrobia bacterium CG22_combo_CG10-13_8_21_14_all_43_17]PIX58696.1 MAG: deoxyribose-phosphate aldolase [Verrucomicrobia bacterium CG_4_10_14_3_um_filter_43_23]PIY62645.1 MAG: deoxyribose-phosphate aldolase [Verrucomicrobia bacterium CG_4_10_14_0_8_um_filter_43_34]PJA43422.1 MAG: deoxyribose-phosphate aldolase [Verrucomicrobia bacterium CG_4_9_14_3_um_filter_43_20
MHKALALAHYIDHTNLAPEATSIDIAKLCDESVQYNFHSVCVNPFWVPFVYKRLEKSPIQVCTVIGFPLGCNLSKTKADEAKQTFDLGADEFDMVINIGLVKEGDWSSIIGEIHQVVEAVKGKCVKVILETCLLTKEEIIKACQASEKAGAHFVKTSTGFSKAGASTEAVVIMRHSISSTMGVKASGGIKDKQTAIAMIEAGATRIGASSSIAIIS